VQKDWLEDLVVRETMKLIQDDAMIDKIVQLVMDVQNQENTTIPLLEKQL
jgi:site-specific DNA recombinase